MELKAPNFVLWSRDFFLDRLDVGALLNNFLKNMSEREDLGLIETTTSPWLIPGFTLSTALPGKEQVNAVARFGMEWIIVTTLHKQGMEFICD